MNDPLADANTLIAKLQGEATTAKSNFDNLTTSHKTLTEQHETVKSTLSQAQTELSTLKESAAKGITQVAELTRQVTDQGVALIANTEALKGYEELKAASTTILEAKVAAQKKVFTDAGVKEEQLEGKSQLELDAMESILANKPKTDPPPTGTVDGKNNGLTGTGAGDNTNNPPQDALTASLDAVKKAKERRIATPN